MVVEILTQLYNSEQQALHKLENIENSSQNPLENSSKKLLTRENSKKLLIRKNSKKLQNIDSKGSLLKYSRQNSLKTGKNSKNNQNKSLYIDSIDPNKLLEQCQNCLEYLLVSFCKHFSLRPKQSAGLLTQSGKYLSHVVSKGLKGKHEPIIA